MEGWDLSLSDPDVEDMNQLDASHHRRRRPTTYHHNNNNTMNTPSHTYTTNAPSHTYLTLDTTPTPHYTPLPLTPQLLRNNDTNPPTPYSHPHSLYNHHASSASSLPLSPALFSPSFPSCPEDKDNNNNESNPPPWALEAQMYTEDLARIPLDRVDSEHLLLHVGSQFDMQHFDLHHHHHHRDTDVPSPSTPSTSPGHASHGPVLLLLFTRIAAALVAIGLGAYRLSTEPMTHQRLAVLSGGLIVAGVTGRGFVVARRRFEDTVDVVLLCLVSCVSLALFAV